jgi:biopolymer transport protein ExbB/TolQ
MWGMADVLLKVAAFPREFLALREEWLPARVGREPAANASALLEQVQSRSYWLRESRIGKRLTQSLEHVAEKGSVNEYREHLQYLAQQDDDLTQSNYTLLRFVVAVSPILGFLGTVVHFGTALSGFSFDDMSSRLPLIVGEMGQAFNTTTVALATTMTMTFALFPCERIEQHIVRTIDRLIDRELLNRFAGQDPEIAPFLTVVQQAHGEAIAEIAVLLQRHVELWTQSLDTLFQKFDVRQQKELQRWQNAVETMQGRFEDYDARQAERFRHSLSLVESHHEQYMAVVRSTLDRAVEVRNDVATFAGTTEALARGGDAGRILNSQEKSTRAA